MTLNIIDVTDAKHLWTSVLCDYDDDDDDDDDDKAKRIQLIISQQITQAHRFILSLYIHSKNYARLKIINHCISQKYYKFLLRVQ